MQMPARTPACAAMTAMTLQALSGNRFLCGIGPSGPQVVEGWHGVPFGKPLARTREYIAIIRQILERKAPLEYHGEHYQIPYTGPGFDRARQGAAQHHPRRSEPEDLHRGDRSGGIANGRRGRGRNLAVLHVARTGDAIVGPVLEGIAKAGNGKTLADFDLAPYIRVSIGDDIEACRDAIRPNFALYIGGMGARSKNFYNDLARRMGYEAEAATIQDHYLAGRRKEAEAAVPDALIDETSLVGPKERISDRLQAWKEIARDHRVGSLVLAGADAAALRVVAEAVL